MKCRTIEQRMCKGEEVKVCFLLSSFSESVADNLGRVYVNKAKIYVGELRGEDCHYGLWFYFTEKEKFGYGFVKLIQKLSSFGLKSTLKM
jgi:hypothetical protein